MGRIAAVAALAMAMAGQSLAHQGPAAPPAGDPVPVEVFAKLPGIEGARLSPDGRRILAKQAVNGAQTLVVLSLFGDVPAVRLGTDDDIDINWWRWVNDDWLIAGVGAKQTMYGQETYITRTISLSADLRTLKRLDWDRSGFRADDVLWVANDGSPRILLSRQTGIMSLDQFYPSVFEIDVSTGRSKLIAGGRTNVFQWFADGRGQVRAGYRYDDQSRRAALLYRASNGEPFREIARRTRGDDSLTIPLTFRDDGTAVAFDDESGFTTLHEVSLPDLAIGRKLYGAEGYDLDGVIDNATENDIAGVNVTERFARTIWFDERLKALQADIDASIGDRRARIVSWNRDRTRFLVEVGSASQAGGLYYWDSAGNRLQRFAWSNDVLKARGLSPVSTIRYQARDGTPIEAILTMPRLRAGQRKLPLIVMPHGGPFARDVEGWDWWSQSLAELGYVVIQPNYRGSSGYGDAFARKGEGEWGLKMQDDLDDAVAHLAKQGVADPARVCMVGASYGGYAAMRAAQRHGSRYRCAVSYAGVSDLAAMRRYDSRFLNARTRADWLRKQAPDFRAVSPRFGAAAFGAPILIVHGKADKRVPVDQSRMMAEELKRAGKAHIYIEQPLADHHFTRGEDRLAFLKAMQAFLGEHNPA